MVSVDCIRYTGEVHTMSYKSTKLMQEFPIEQIITIHYFEYMKNFVFRGESHDFWEFLYVDKGEIIVQADDLRYELHAGDIIFHKPNEFHAIQSIGSKAPNLVAISFLCTSPAMHFFEQKSCTLAPEERLFISQIISEAHGAFSTPLYIPMVEEVVVSENAPFGSQELILLYLRTFLIQVKRNHLDSSIKLKYTPISSLPVQPHSSDRLNDIIQYMEFHICDQLSIEDICLEFSISRSTLHSLFHKTEGCGAIDYFNTLKIQRAQEIIKDDTMNFTEIAYFLSYSSLQYFSKQFKKATGMSPLEYSNSVKKYSNVLTNAARRLSPDTSA